MKLLFIGGTRFVGLAMAEEALARGHEVEVFHRGQGASAQPAGARHRLGDRHGDLAALTAADAGPWDAVIDVCAYRPHEVEAVAAALRGRCGRLVLVSTVSVYDAAIAPGGTEDAALADPAVLGGADPRTVAIDAKTYGALKVLCEREALRHDPQALLLRPSFVFGPRDPTHRFAVWVRRLADGGVVPAPGPAEAPMQWIDARDLAAFALDAIEAGRTGAFHLAGPQPPSSFGAMLETVREAVAPPGTALQWLPPETARQQAEAAASAAGGAGTGAGAPPPPPLWPLWTGGERVAALALDTARARAAGLRCRPLAETARDTLAWLRQGG